MKKIKHLIEYIKAPEEEKLKIKKYKKMNFYYKKELKKLTKNSHPFDYAITLNFLITNLKWMRDYYKLGYNVWGEDIGDKRLTTLTEALDEYDAWQNCDNKYFIHHETGGKENERGVPFQNEDGTVTRSDWWIEYACEDNYKITTKAFNKEYKEHREKFFKIIAKNIEFWWD